MMIAWIFLNMFFISFAEAIGLNQQLRSNIILFITDDQDIELGSMEFMPKTLKLMRERGLEFRNAFVSTPICCPSRSTIFTGLYVHNHNVHTNNANCSGSEWRNVHEKQSFVAFLKEHSNYRTGYFGKYLNEYDGSYIPPGWDEWMGLVRNSRFYNYSLNINGQTERHGYDYAKDYFTDLITNKTINFMEQTIISHLQSRFLAVLSFPAPHGPEDPAPQYADMFENVETHRTAAWNYAPNPDKQWLLQRTGKMEPIHVVFTDLLHRRRLQTLQSVDDAVQRVLAYLRSANELQNTYVIFTSDHGYHLGQFGLIKGKNMPYEFDIKVPFLMRGPGIPRGKTMTQVVANLDIAPTILAMAGISPPSHMDGRSILDLIFTSQKEKFKHGVTNWISNLNSSSWRQTLLVERGKMPKLRRIQDRVLRLKNRFSKAMRINEACSKLEYQGDCVENQHWQCVRNEIGEWRIHKCRTVKGCFCDENVEIRERRDLTETNNWEDEFLRDVEQQRIIDSGEWFQGVFELAFSSKIRNESTLQKKAVFIRERAKRETDLVKFLAEVKGICSRSNFTFCNKFDEDLLMESGYWEKHRHKINSKIRTLKAKLSTFKEMRKAMRQNLPSKLAEENGCDCRQKHPAMISASEFSSTTQTEPRRLSKFARKKERWRQDFLKKWNNTSSNATRDELSANFEDNALKCNVVQMNCFHHTSHHWRTPPFWPEQYGEFCFCQNSNNNTYWCLRTVNETHNFLYCEFITEFISYYDLNNDPYQLHNIIYELELRILEQLSSQLRKLKQCRTAAECEHFSSKNWHLPFLPPDSLEKNYE